MTKQQAKEQIEQLVERFDYHAADYRKGNYNETQTRNDFINQFFEALGWDVNNRQGLAECYREVIHEDKISISGSTKAPDYCFTVYGQRKFFLEAKKPSVNIKEQAEPAYQLRRYGWSAKMPISLITDFEELAIYDCTIKPIPTDKASVARIKYMTYKDYLKEFDFLWETFSKEQVLKGSFDKFVLSNKGKKGTTGVDAEFLKSLDGWRDLLARNIVNRNQAIGEDELNYSLQKIIDRLIFLRICEDRGVEREDQLRNAMGLNAFENLKQIFHIADQKYNSGLFDYKKDTITDNLVIDDKILKSIIEEMYYPKSPYEFSVIPVEILGHSYEQYLGKVIKITPGHRIKIEEKPEVRKAGGVYYTPQYIVDYIVKNTVGKLVEGKTPEEVAKIKICDPACGSGSFLLGAYQYLLDWHSAYYQNQVQNTPRSSVGLIEPTPNISSKSTPRFSVGSEAVVSHSSTPRFSVGLKTFLTPDGHLTTSVKKQILLNNIHGVDIDTNAVEVTKLSLMLKAMEGETEASINNQLSLYHERVLPTLDNNIKSGNSLIDLDFYDGKIDFEPETEKKIKPFNWENAFPEVFKQKVFEEQLEAFHITWATYNSRPEGKGNYGSAILLNDVLRKAVAKYLDEKIAQGKYRIISMNILNDHVHSILVCKKEDLSEVVRNLKGYSSYKLHRDPIFLQNPKSLPQYLKTLSQDPTLKRGVDSAAIQPNINPTLQRGVGATVELCESSVEDSSGGASPKKSDTLKLWAKDFSQTYINDEEHLLNTISYIENNHLKHNISKVDYKFRNLTPLSKAFEPRKEQGGFDAVIGNPPYVNAIALIDLFPNERDYITQSINYKTTFQKWDLYIPFIEKGINILKKYGLISMIIPYPFITQNYAKLLRETMINDYNLVEIVDLSGQKIFKDATVTNCIFVLSKSEPSNHVQISSIQDSIISVIDNKTYDDIIQETKNSVWNLKTEKKVKICLENFKTLGDYCFISIGMVLNADEKKAKGKFIKDDLISDYETEICKKKYIEAKNIARYKIGTIRFLEWDTSRVPSLIRRPTFPELYEVPKIIITKIGELKATYDSNNLYCDQTIRVVVLWKHLKGINNNSINNSVKRYSNDNRINLEINSEKIEYNLILGILNSKFGNYLLNQIRGVGNIDINPDYLKQIPIPANPNSETRDNLIKLVESMLQLNKDLQQAVLPEQKEQIKARINYTDKKIDKLVYELYGLTEEEIRIVEGE